MTAEPEQDKISIEVVLAMPDRQELVSLQVEPGTSLAVAIELSGLAELFDGFELDLSKVGVFGHKTEPDRILSDGDRVEIYRSLIADPKEVRRQRALKQKDP